MHPVTVSSCFEVHLSQSTRFSSRNRTRSPNPNISDSAQIVDLRKFIYVSEISSFHSLLIDETKLHGSVVMTTDHPIMLQLSTQSIKNSENTFEIFRQIFFHHAMMIETKLELSYYSSALEFSFFPQA